MTSDPCPCGSDRTLAACCGRFLDAGRKPETAEELMRSRYAAYALRRPLYLYDSWHPRTRPRSIDLGSKTEWLGLTILGGTIADDHSTVEFVARYRERGTTAEIRENSRFEKRRGAWVYVDAVD